MMFALQPSSLPGRKGHTQLGIVRKGACLLAPSLSFTHTYNKGRLGSAFPWRSAPAKLPTVAAEHDAKCCEDPCMRAERGTERYLVQ